MNRVEQDTILAENYGLIANAIDRLEATEQEIDTLHEWHRDSGHFTEEEEIGFITSLQADQIVREQLELIR